MGARRRKRKKIEMSLESKALAQALIEVYNRYRHRSLGASRPVSGVWTEKQWMFQDLASIDSKEVTSFSNA